MATALLGAALFVEAFTLFLAVDAFEPAFIVRVLEVDLADDAFEGLATTLLTPALFAAGFLAVDFLAAVTRLAEVARLTAVPFLAEEALTVLVDRVVVLLATTRFLAVDFVDLLAATLFFGADLEALFATTLFLATVLVELLALTAFLGADLAAVLRLVATDLTVVLEVLAFVEALLAVDDLLAALLVPTLEEDADFFVAVFLVEADFAPALFLITITEISF